MTSSILENHRYMYSKVISVSSVISILYMYSVYVLYCAHYILHETKRERQLAQELRTLKAQLSAQLSGGSIFPPFTPNLEVKYLGGQI